MVITTLTFLTGGGRHRSASCKITKMTKWQNYESIFIFSVESVCREMLLMVDAHSELWLTRAFTLFSTFRRDAPFNQTVDTLHCRADGKDNKHTWEKWFLDMCVCVCVCMIYGDESAFRVMLMLCILFPPPATHTLTRTQRYCDIDMEGEGSEGTSGQYVTLFVPMTFTNKTVKPELLLPDTTELWKNLEQSNIHQSFREVYWETQCLLQRMSF